MTSDLSYALAANGRYTGTNNKTGEEMTFSTGSKCTTRNQNNCIINPNANAPASNGKYYYTWFGATAGGSYDSVTGEAIYSICPAKWRLPTWYYETPRQKSYASIMNAYGLADLGSNFTRVMSSELGTFPFDKTLDGHFVDDYLYFVGVRSIVWTARKCGDSCGTMAAHMSAAPYGGPLWSGSTYQAMQVRCVAL